MRSDYLHYFAVIAESGSLSLAAKRLFISQQALSRILKNMEQELNCQLAVRGRKGVILTENGEYVLTMAKKVQNTIEELEQHFHTLPNSNVSGQLMIANTSYLGRFILPAPFIRFNKNYPNISIHHKKTDTISAIIQSVQDGSVDMGFFCYSPLAEYPDYHFPEDCEFHVWKKQHLRIFASKELPICRYSVVPDKEIGNYTLIFSGEEESLQENSIYKIAHHLNTALKPPLIVANELIQAELVRNGIGIAILPEDAYHGMDEVRELPMERDIEIRPVFCLTKRIKTRFSLLA